MSDNSGFCKYGSGIVKAVNECNNNRRTDNKRVIRPHRLRDEQSQDLVSFIAGITPYVCVPIGFDHAVGSAQTRSAPDIFGSIGFDPASGIPDTRIAPDIFAVLILCHNGFLLKKNIWE